MPICRLGLIAVLVVFLPAVPALSSAASEPVNLLPLTFKDLNAAKLPAGYEISISGENPAAAKVSAEQDDTGATVVKVEIPREASVHLNTVRRTPLDPGGEYFFVVQLKAENLRHTGDWYKKPAGIRIYIAGLEGEQCWMAVWGEGSSKGWLTAILPFPNKKGKKQFASVLVLLRCYNMTGTVRFRNPMILRKPDGIDMQASFEMEDGTRVFGNNLQLRP